MTCLEGITGFSWLVLSLADGVRIKFNAAARIDFLDSFQEGKT